MAAERGNSTPNVSTTMGGFKSALDEYAAKNNEIIQSLREVTDADADSLSGMGVDSDEWKKIYAVSELRPYLRVRSDRGNQPTREVYFLGYVAAQFLNGDCVHISLALGQKDKINILDRQTSDIRPTVYNATRDAGVHLATALSWAVHEANMNPDALTCLARMIPGIPQGDPNQDKGLHMSLFNKSPNGGTPAAQDVRDLQEMFDQGVAMQLELAELKIVKGLRCNDMATGGMYYLACGMSDSLMTLCNLIKDRFSESIKSFAPHVSLELWGVGGCKHPQQTHGSSGDAKYWFCDYLRWGMDVGVFDKCLDSRGRFDLARYMYMRTQGPWNDIDAAKVGDTLKQLDNFDPDAIEKFIEKVTGYNGFGCIKAEQRLHDRGSPVYKFFKKAPAHPGLDCAQSRIKNCASAAGEGCKWFPGTEFQLPSPEVQEVLQKYIVKCNRRSCCRCQ